MRRRSRAVTALAAAALLSACTLAAVNERHYTQAMMALDQHHWNTAIKHLQAIQPEHDVYPLAARQLQEVRQRLTQMYAAEATAKEAFENQNWSLAAAQYQAVLEIWPEYDEARDRYVEAEAYAKIVRRQAEEAAAARRQAERARAKATAVGKAPPVVEITDADRTQVDEALAEANREVARGHHAEAVKVLRAAPNIDYRREEMIDVLVQAHADLGRMYYRQTDYAHAAEQFRAAHELRADDDLRQLMEKSQKLADALAD